MNTRINVDRISAMPENIIDSILTRLPIHEAARTSILSSSWRWRWHSLSKVILNCDDLQQVSKATLLKTINSILLVHHGSIEKFKLNLNLKTCGDIEFTDIDRWIIYVLRNGIKMLTINKEFGKRYNLPSYLFSCSHLTHLKLTRCIFKTPPAEFKTFRNLAELDLIEISITQRGLENLINSCPLLSGLSLRGIKVDLRSSIKINAPNLVKFRLHKFCCYPQFKNTPLLTSAWFAFTSCDSVDAAENKEGNIVELFGSIPVIQSLQFGCGAFQLLSVGDVPERLPLPCPVKHLEMPIDLENMQERKALFCIFRSSPFIQFLHLKCWSLMDDLRISAHDFNFKFDHLKEVKLDCASGTEIELKLIKFILGNSPDLRKMLLSFYRDDEENMLRINEELNKFPHISPNAQLIMKSG